MEGTMDTLQDRLAALADDAPTGGAPPGELWARGRRSQRLRVTALGAAALMVFGTVGTSVGVRLLDSDGDRSSLASPGKVDVALPIEYPTGQALMDLGDTPGPLAAVWWDPRPDGEPPAAVGLVAATGRFGTLALPALEVTDEIPASADVLALAPDGRRIAYRSQQERLVVRDLVSGRSESVEFDGFGTRTGFTWVDDRRLVGHVAGGSDADGWVWESGKDPKQVDLLSYLGSTWLGAQAGIDPWFHTQEDPEAPCTGADRRQQRTSGPVRHPRGHRSRQRAHPLGRRGGRPRPRRLALPRVHPASRSGGRRIAGHRRVRISARRPAARRDRKRVMTGYASFEEFVVARRAALQRTAYLLTGNHHDAEDLVQSALIKVVPKWARIKDSPEPYVRQVLARESVSRWRGRRWREVVTDVVPEVTHHDSTDRIALLEDLRRLSPRQRAVLVLRYFDDLTEADTAAALGISVGTVKSHVRDALAGLRSQQANDHSAALT